MLICGDVLCELKKLESDSVDMGITSPPYNKQENKKGWLVKNVKYDAISDKKEEAIYQEEQIAVLNELYRIIKPGGSFFYNHKIRRERGVMLHPIFWLAKSKWHIHQEIIWDRGIAANIRGWRFWQVEERIFWLHKPRDKKDFIGIDISENYIQSAKIRLQNYCDEQKIIESEKALHQVAETFSQKKARGMHKDKLKKTKEAQPNLFQSATPRQKYFPVCFFVALVLF